MTVEVQLNSFIFITNTYYSNMIFIDAVVARRFKYKRGFKTLKLY